MKFIARELKETADASAGGGSQARELGKLVLTLLVALIVLYIFIGITVDVVVARISVKTEKALFSAIPISQVGTGEHPDAQKQMERARGILAKLCTHPDVPKLDYQLFLVEQEDPNAFAFPGGSIGVTTGLLDALDDEMALAFVLGHELGHFRNRDHLRGLGRGIGIGVCSALLFGGSAGADLLASNAIMVMSRRYSRGQEEKADAFGVMLVQNAYGHANGITTLFELLEKQDTAPKWAYMFATHPLTADRIRALRKQAAAFEAATKDAARDVTKKDTP